MTFFHKRVKQERIDEVVTVLQAFLNHETGPLVSGIGDDAMTPVLQLLQEIQKKIPPCDRTTWTCNGFRLAWRSCPPAS